MCVHWPRPSNLSLTHTQTVPHSLFPSSLLHRSPRHAPTQYLLHRIILNVGYTHIHHVLRSISGSIPIIISFSLFLPKFCGAPFPSLSSQFFLTCHRHSRRSEPSKAHSHRLAHPRYQISLSGPHLFLKRIIYFSFLFFTVACETFQCHAGLSLSLLGLSLACRAMFESTDLGGAAQRQQQGEREGSEVKAKASEAAHRDPFPPSEDADAAAWGRQDSQDAAPETAAALPATAGITPIVSLTLVPPATTSSSALQEGVGGGEVAVAVAVGSSLASLSAPQRSAGGKRERKSLQDVAPDQHQQHPSTSRSTTIASSAASPSSMEDGLAAASPRRPHHGLRLFLEPPGGGDGQRCYDDAARVSAITTYHGQGGAEGGDLRCRREEGLKAADGKRGIKKKTRLHSHPYGTDGAHASEPGPLPPPRESGPPPPFMSNSSGGWARRRGQRKLRRPPRHAAAHLLHPHRVPCRPLRPHPHLRLWFDHHDEGGESDPGSSGGGGAEAVAGVRRHRRRRYARRRHGRRSSPHSWSSGGPSTASFAGATVSCSSTGGGLLRHVSFKLTPLMFTRSAAPAAPPRSSPSSPAPPPEGAEANGADAARDSKEAYLMGSAAPKKKSAFVAVAVPQCSALKQPKEEAVDLVIHSPPHGAGGAPRGRGEAGEDHLGVTGGLERLTSASFSYSPPEHRGASPFIGVARGSDRAGRPAPSPHPGSAAAAGERPFSLQGSGGGEGGRGASGSCSSYATAPYETHLQSPPLPGDGETSVSLSLSLSHSSRLRAKLLQQERVRREQDQHIASQLRQACEQTKELVTRNSADVALAAAGLGFKVVMVPPPSEIETWSPSGSPSIAQQSESRGYYDDTDGPAAGEEEGGAGLGTSPPLRGFASLRPASGLQSRSSGAQRRMEMPLPGGAGPPGRPPAQGGDPPSRTPEGPSRRTTAPASPARGTPSGSTPPAPRVLPPFALWTNPSSPPSPCAAQRQQMPPAAVAATALRSWSRLQADAEEPSRRPAITVARLTLEGGGDGPLTVAAGGDGGGITAEEAGRISSALAMAAAAAAGDGEGAGAGLHTLGSNTFTFSPSGLYPSEMDVGSPTHGHWESAGSSGMDVVQQFLTQLEHLNQRTSGGGLTALAESLLCSVQHPVVPRQEQQEEEGEAEVQVVEAHPPHPLDETVERLAEAGAPTAAEAWSTEGEAGGRGPALSPAPSSTPLTAASHHLPSSPSTRSASQHPESEEALGATRSIRIPRSAHTGAEGWMLPGARPGHGTRLSQPRVHLAPPPRAAPGSEAAHRASQPAAAAASPPSRLYWRESQSNPLSVAATSSVPPAPSHLPGDSLLLDPNAILTAAATAIHFHPPSLGHTLLQPATAEQTETAPTPPRPATSPTTAQQRRPASQDRSAAAAGSVERDTSFFHTYLPPASSRPASGHNSGSAHGGEPAPTPAELFLAREMSGGDLWGSPGAAHTPAGRADQGPVMNTQLRSVRHPHPHPHPPPSVDSVLSLHSSAESDGLGIHRGGGGGVNLPPHRLNQPPPQTTASTEIGRRRLAGQPIGISEPGGQPATRPAPFPLPGGRAGPQNSSAGWVGPPRRDPGTRGWDAVGPPLNPPPPQPQLSFTLPTTETGSFMMEVDEL
eukprot:gene841-478_t